MRALTLIALLLAGCTDAGLWSEPREHEVAAGATGSSGAASSASSSSSGTTTSSTTGTTGTTSSTTGTTSTTATSTSTSTTSSTSSTGTTGISHSATVASLGQLTLSNGGPYDVAIASDGTAYVTTAPDNVIASIDTGGQGHIFAGAEGAFSENTDAQGSSARFAIPWGIAVVGTTLYVADQGDDSDYAELRTIDSSANVHSVCGTGLYDTSLDGPCSSAKFGGPTGICSDGAGGFYVTDTNTGTLRHVTSGFTRVDTIGNPGDLSAPFDVAMDPSGNVFVADYGTASIKKFDSSQTVSTFAALPSQPAAVYAVGVAADAAGNIYASDPNNAHVYRFDPSGNLTADITNANITNPAGLTIGPDGALYVADTGSGQVLRVVIH